MNPRAGRLTGLLDSARTSLWPLPLLSLVLAVGLGVGLPVLDGWIGGRLPGAVSALLFSGGPAAARAVLQAVAGSLITVTSLTFSLTVVTLQLASSQFSPRLLRTFARDTFVQVTLALFLGTFTYALTVLRTVRSPDEGEPFVPQLAVTLAFLGTVASVVALVLFLAHLARRIRVESMVEDVRDEALATLRRQLPEDGGPPERPRAVPPARPAGRPSLVTAAASGFLASIDDDALLDAAIATGTVLVLDRRVGDFAVSGTPLALTWSLDADAAVDTERLGRAVARAVTIGSERTSVQDLAFGLQQLADVATKALSPGINDPTTAVHAIDQAAAVLCEAARRDHGPGLRRDDEGRVRVTLRRRDLDELLDLVISPVRRYAAGEPDALAAVLRLLRDVAWVAPAARRPEVAGHVQRVRDSASDDLDAAARRRLAGLAADADQALRGEWPSPLAH